MTPKSLVESWLYTVLHSPFRLVIRQYSLFVPQNSTHVVPNVSKWEFQSNNATKRNLNQETETQIVLIFLHPISIQKSHLKEDSTCQALHQLIQTPKIETFLIEQEAFRSQPCCCILDTLPIPWSAVCIVQEISVHTPRCQTNDKQTCLHNSHYLYHSSM